VAKEVYFKTNTLLKNLVGKDLINEDSIAVIELVKNSIDASATSIFIKFINEAQDEESFGPDSKIIISDNGSGMNESDILDKWLNIAYSEKSNALNKSGDFYAGNKGVGRFSCDRLGVQLDMFTRSSSEEILWLNVNWLDFEVEGKKNLLIQNIPVQLSTATESELHEMTGLDRLDQGTVLLISGLRNNWNRDSLLALKKSLEKFISPNQAFQSDEFSIYLEAENLLGSDKDKKYHESVNGKIKNLVFENLEFNSTYITSEISKDGQYISTALFHDGDAVYRLKEKNHNYPLLKNIGTKIFFLNPYKKAYFTRQTGIRSVDFGSIFLFVNGFRVAPYGDKGNDWLKLDVRKAQGTSRYLGTREVIGRIEILDRDKVFEQISSREGLKNEPPFIELKEKYFIDLLRKLEKFIKDGLGWDSVPEALRKDLSVNEGLDWSDTNEQYVESWDKKQKRISRSILTLIGTSKTKAVEFWFNPKLLDDLSSQKDEYINNLLNQIEGYDTGQVDDDLIGKLKGIKDLLNERHSEVVAANEQIIELQDELEEQSVVVEQLEQKTEELEQKTARYESQTLFLKSVTTLDKSSLLSYHHQICLDSSIVENYLGKLVKQLQSGNQKELLSNIQKISKANKRILTTAQYATKANFKSGTKKEPTNIPDFFEQYILTVAKDFIASGINIHIDNMVNQAFEIKIKRIELAMLIDNLISNSNKAHAKNLNVKIELTKKDQVTISFTDDGKGLSKDIDDLNSLFNMGVTTTKGSGLGLFHAKEIMDSVDGEISIVKRESKGFEIRMVFER